MENKLKFIDLFSGIGGFRLGMEHAGHECIGYCEIDKFARKSYRAMYDTENEWNAKDITQVTDYEWRELNEKYGQINIICGGFPCQTFSVAGKRKGFKDKTKGTLFFQIARAVEQIKPQYILLENVKGIINHKSGETFRTVLSTFDELGYDVEWSVRNSKDHGVPQSRERVYIIGHLRGASTSEVFFEKGQTRENTAEVKYFYNARKHGDFGTRDIVHVSGISKTLETMTGGNRQPKVAIPVLAPDRVNKNQNRRRFKEDGDPMYTSTTQDRHGVLLNNMQIRKLTPKECWRLQGFPDELFKKAQQVNSDSQLYKQAGNSVTVPVIEWIAQRMSIKLKTEEVA